MSKKDDRRLVTKVHTYLKTVLMQSFVASNHSNVVQRPSSSKKKDLQFFGTYCVLAMSKVYYHNNIIKSAQSNLGRGPRRGTVVLVRRKVSIGCNGAPQIRPQKYPFLWTDPQTSLPASSLDPFDLWLMPNGILIRSAVFCTMHWTDRRTDW